MCTQMYMMTGANEHVYTGFGSGKGIKVTAGCPQN